MKRVNLFVAVATMVQNPLRDKIESACATSGTQVVLRSRQRTSVSEHNTVLMKTWLLALVFSATLPAQPPKMHLPDETAGLDGIVRTLISAFDQADIVALGEWHGRIRLDSDLRIAMVRHRDFAKKVRSIVVEFGSTTEQSTLDR
jgi:hypothetical protein